MTETQTGTLLVADRSVRTVLPALGAAALGTALLTGIAVPLFPYLLPGLDAPARNAATAILAYVLFRLLYPAALRRFPGGGTREAAWTVTADALSVDGRTVPRSDVREVHIWPGRDALGHPLPGWTVNIETAGRNILLRVPDGDGGELRALITALGYGDRWPHV